MNTLLSAACISLLALTVVDAKPPVVFDTAIHTLEDRRVIVERASGIQLPDPPPPPVITEPSPEAAERFAQTAQAWRTLRDANPFIHAGATVYRLPDGSTVTHVNGLRVNNEPAIDFWTSADLSLLAGKGGFTTERGVNYSLLLMWSEFDIGKWKTFMRRRGIDYEIPEMPRFPEHSPATWRLSETTDKTEPGPKTRTALLDIHNYYNQHRHELDTAYQKRQAELAAHRAELAANPIKPRDIHLRVSRLAPAQAAAWHAHASAGKRPAPSTQSDERKGGAK